MKAAFRWCCCALALIGGASRAGEAVQARGIDERGAAWAIEIPAQWNGTLLLYSRGYAPTPPASPETAPRGMRETLLERGYALAASAYSAGGWSVAEAPGDQLRLLDAFIERHGKPRRTIAWGSSMGGLVTIALAEREPSRFHGAMSLCGSVSGSLGMLNTALDGAFAFRTLLAPDSALRVVDIDDDRENARRAQAVLEEAWKDPQGRARVMLAAALAQLPLWSDPNSPQPAADDLDAQAEQVRRTFVMGTFVPRTDQEKRSGGITSWNDGVDYRAQLERSGQRALVQKFYARAGVDLDADLARLASAPRIRADASAVNYMRANYVPTGQLRIPVLTLHTLGDGLTVPATQGSFAALVRDAGRGKMLAQVHVKAAGHCTFTPAELRAALLTLENRIARGRWDLTPQALRNTVADVPASELRFVNARPPALLRHCGARPGSCAGEPARASTAGAMP